MLVGARWELRLSLSWRFCRAYLRSMELPRLFLCFFVSFHLVAWFHFIKRFLLFLSMCQQTGRQCWLVVCLTYRGPYFVVVSTLLLFLLSSVTFSWFLDIFAIYFGLVSESLVGFPALGSRYGFCKSCPVPWFISGRFLALMFIVVKFGEEGSRLARYLQCWLFFWLWPSAIGGRNATLLSKLCRCRLFWFVFGVL